MGETNELSAFDIAEIQDDRGGKTARIDEKLLTAVGLKLFTPNEDKFARPNY